MPNSPVISRSRSVTVLADISKTLPTPPPFDRGPPGQIGDAVHRVTAVDRQVFAGDIDRLEEGICHQRRGYPRRRAASTASWMRP